MNRPAAFGYLPTRTNAPTRTWRLLKDVPNLTEVFLYDVFSNRGLEHLRGLDRLDELALCYNSRITDDGLAPLASLTDVKALMLRGPGVPPVSARRLLERAGAALLERTCEVALS